jgi:hypothetical protein
MKTPFTCSVCKLIKTEPEDSCTAGYGTDKQGNKICFDCIGKQEREEMKNAKPGQRFTMYLTDKDGNKTVSNWPGTVKIPVYYSRKSWHNFTGKNGRTDVWFNFEGKHFWGYSIGDFTQIVHIKAVK